MPLIAALLFAAAVQIQTAPPPQPPSPLADLNADEHVRFDAAAKSFNAGQFAMALPVFKGLLVAHPGNLLLAKYTSEASMDMADPAFAAATLKPLEEANPQDWQLAVLMTRFYAETGDKAGRDREMEKIAALQKKRMVPANVTQYIVEKDHLADGKLMILFNSIVPWGNYKVCNYARIFDKDGALTLRITLETSDFDQPLFAKDHPQEAAFGDRRYSIDGYRTGPTGAQGQRTETHITFGFLDKKPTYDEVRERFTTIAQGKAGAMSSTEKTVQPGTPVVGAPK